MINFSYSPKNLLITILSLQGMLYRQVILAFISPYLSNWLLISFRNAPTGLGVMCFILLALSKWLMVRKNTL